MADLADRIRAIQEAAGRTPERQPPTAFGALGLQDPESLRNLAETQPSSLEGAGFENFGATTREQRIRNIQIAARGHDVPPPFSSPRRQRAALEARGVSAEGAPSSARALAGLVPQGGAGAFSPEDVHSAALSTALGTDIKARYGETGKLEYVDPATGQLTVVDEPGFGIGDIADLSGFAIEATAELGGAIGGGALGAEVMGVGMVPGSVVGGSIGAGAGMFLRLWAAREAGVLPPNITDRQLSEMAVTEAGVPSLYAGAAGALGARYALSPIGRAMVARLTGGKGGRSLITALGRGEVPDLGGELSRARKVAGRFSEVTGEEFPVTGGQVAGGVQGAEALAARELQLARDARTADPFLAIDEAQQRQLSGALDSIGERAGVKSGDEAADAFKTGGSIKAEFDRRLLKAESQADAQLEKQRLFTEGEEAARVGDEAALYQRFDLPQEFRGIAVMEQGIESEMTAELYREIDLVAERLKVPELFPLQTRQVLRDEIKFIKKNVFPKLDDVDRDFLTASLDEITRTSGAGKAPKALSLGELQATLRTVRNAIRGEDVGLTATPSSRSLKKLRAALIADRNEILEDFPELRVKIAQAEKAVRDGKKILDRSVVGEILRTRGGQPLVGDENVFNRATRTADNSEATANLLKTQRGADSPESVAIYEDAFNGFRRGILDEYRKDVLDKATPKAKVTAHNRWVKKWVESGRAGPWFSEKEMTQVRQLGGIEDAMFQSERKRARVERQLNQSFGASLAGSQTDEGAFFKVWRQGDEGTVRQFKEDVKDNPFLWNQFQEAAHRDLKEFLIRQTPEGPKIDFGKLQEYITKRRGKLATTFGKGYVNDLQAYADAVQLVLRRPSRLLSQQDSMLFLLSRPIVPPLSQRGRVRTVVNTLFNRGRDIRMAEILADPERLDKLMKARNRFRSANATMTLTNIIRFGVEADLDDELLIPDVGGFLGDQILGEEQ